MGHGSPKLWLAAVVVWLTVASAAFARGEQRITLPETWKGIWMVQTDLGAPGISALTEAQANSMLGQRIRLLDGDVRFPNDSCNAAVFAIVQQNMTDFLLEYRLTPEQFHLVGTRVQTLEVGCKHSVTYRLSLLETGCVVFAQEGHFFQVVKLHAQREASSRRRAKCLSELSQ